MSATRSATWPIRRSRIMLRRASNRGELVRVPLQSPVDLGRDVECALDQAPAGHPVPCPARLVLGDRTRLLHLDAAQVEVAGRQRLHLGVPGPITDEVRDIPSLVRVDAMDGLGDGAKA